MRLEAAGGVDRQGVIDVQAGPPQHGIQRCRRRVRQDPGLQPAVAQGFERARDLRVDGQIPERTRGSGHGRRLGGDVHLVEHVLERVRGHLVEVDPPLHRGPQPRRLELPRPPASGELRAPAGRQSIARVVQRPQREQRPEQVEEDRVDRPAGSRGHACDAGLATPRRRPARLVDRALVLDRADVAGVEVERHGLEDAPHDLAAAGLRQHRDEREVADDRHRARARGGRSGAAPGGARPTARGPP